MIRKKPGMTCIESCFPAAGRIMAPAKFFLHAVMLCMAAAGTLAVTGTAVENTMVTAYAATTLDWYSVTLDTDGNCSWEHSALSASDAVDKYEIRLSRQNNGNWTENYKTYTTTDNSYSISFSSKGKYYIKVRAKLIGGGYTDWSPASPTVAVTSDDIDSDSSSVSYNYYYNTGSYYTGYGPGGYSDYNYYGPAGPGSGTSYSNTSVINTVTGTYVNGNANAYNGQYSTYNGNQASGWIKVSNGYMYRYSNGTYVRNGWDRIDGYWYYFDANGIMRTGWLYIDNKWYYALPSGRIATSGWNNINEKWYYFNESGIMQTGYIVLDGKTYYTDSSGARVQSAYNPDGHLFDLNGVMVQ